MRFIELGDSGGSEVARQAANESGPWLNRLLPRWADRRFVRAESRKAMRLYNEVHQERPDLQGHGLYEEIVRRCLDTSPERAVQIVRRAEDSFAAWPAARDVRFRDVVSYIVFDRLIVDGHRTATRADLEGVVADVIPRAM